MNWTREVFRKMEKSQWNTTLTRALTQEPQPPPIAKGLPHPLDFSPNPSISSWQPQVKSETLAPPSPAAGVPSTFCAREVGSVLHLSPAPPCGFKVDEKPHRALSWPELSLPLRHNTPSQTTVRPLGVKHHRILIVCDIEDLSSNDPSQLLRSPRAVKCTNVICDSP